MSSTRLELRPFIAPKFVIAQLPPRPKHEGWVEPPKFPLNEIDADTLSEMCDEYRAAVFRNAGKPDPRHAAQPLEDTRDE